MGISGVGAGVGIASYSALSGMRDATLRLDNAASNIANANTSGFQVGKNVQSWVQEGDGNSLLPFSQTDLATELVTVVSAKAAFQANAALLKAQDEMEKSLIDELG